MAVHVARIALMPVDAGGTVLDKNTSSLKAMVRTSTEPRIIADPSLSNTAGSPSIKTYLEREAGSGYTLRHLDQTFCITYNS